MAKFHWEHDADITVAVQPVRKEEAGRFGILKRRSDCSISDFAEKPKDEETLARMVSREDEERPYLGSMGVYMFKTEVLFELLAETTSDDFGNHVIPNAIGVKQVYGYDFEGYWEDIGTIRSFYDTNLLLTRQNSPFNFFDQNRPIYSRARFLPGSRIDNSVLKEVMLTDGFAIFKVRKFTLIIGLRSQ